MDRFDAFLASIISAQDSSSRCQSYDDFLKICTKDVDTQIENEISSQLSASSVEPTKLSKLLKYVRNDLPNDKSIQLRCRSTSMLSWLFSYNFLRHPVDSNTLDSDDETGTIIYLLIANLKEATSNFIDDPSNSNNNHLLDGTLFLFANQCIPTHIKVHYMDILSVLCKALTSFDEVNKKCNSLHRIFGTYLLFIRVLAHMNISQQIFVNNKPDVKLSDAVMKIFIHYFKSELSDSRKYVADIVTINQFIVDVSNLLRIFSCDEVKLIEFATSLEDMMHYMDHSLEDKASSITECAIYTTKLKQMILVLSSLLYSEKICIWFIDLIIKDNKIGVLIGILLSLFKKNLGDITATIDKFRLLKCVINAFTMVPEYHDKKSIIRIFFKFVGPFLHYNEIIKSNSSPSPSDKFLESKKDASVAREAYGCVISLFSRSWPYGFHILNTSEKKVNGTEDGGLKIKSIVGMLISALNGDSMVQMINNNVVSRDYVYEVIINSSRLMITMLNAVNVKDSTICSYSSTVTNQEYENNPLENMIEISQNFDSGLFAPTNFDNTITFDMSMIATKIEETTQYLKWLSICFQRCSDMYDLIQLDDNQRLTVKEIVKRLVYSWQIAINAIGTYFLYFNTNVSTQFTQTQTSHTIFTCDGEGNRDDVLSVIKQEPTYEYIISTIEALVADCWCNCWSKVIGKSMDKSRGLFIESVWWILHKFSAFNTELKHEKSLHIIISEIQKDDIACTMTAYILSLTFCHVKLLSLNELNIIDITALNESPLQLIFRAINRSTNSIIQTESTMNLVNFILSYLLNPLRNNYVDTPPYLPCHDNFSSVYYRPCIKDERSVNQVILCIVCCMIYAIKPTTAANAEISCEQKLPVAIGLGKIINIPLLLIMKGQMGMNILASKFSPDYSNEGNSHANSSDSYHLSSLSNTIHRSQSTIQSSNLDDTVHIWRGFLNSWLKLQRDVDENITDQDKLEQIQQGLGCLPLTSSNCSQNPLQLECGGILTLNPRSPAMLLFEFDVSIRLILAGLEEIDNNKSHNNDISLRRTTTCCKNLVDIFVNVISGWCQAIKSIKYDEVSFGSTQYQKFSEDAKCLLSSTTLHHILKLLKGDEYKRGSKSYKSTILSNFLLNSSSQISISKRKFTSSGLADSIGAKTGSYEYVQSSSVHSTPQRINNHNKFEEVIVGRHIIVILSIICDTILAVAAPSSTYASYKNISKAALDTFENSILSSWPLLIIECISDIIVAHDHTGKEIIQRIIDLTINFCTELVNIDSKNFNIIKNTETRNEINNFLQQHKAKLDHTISTSLNKILTSEKSPSSTLPTTSSPMTAIFNSNTKTDVTYRKRKPSDDINSVEYVEGNSSHSKMKYNETELIDTESHLYSDKEVDFDYSAATASANAELNCQTKNSDKFVNKNNCDELLKYFQGALESISAAITYADSIDVTKSEADKEEIKSILLDHQLKLLNNAGIITNMLKKLQ